MSQNEPCIGMDSGQIQAHIKSQVLAKIKLIKSQSLFTLFYCHRSHTGDLYLSLICAASPFLFVVSFLCRHMNTK